MEKLPNKVFIRINENVYLKDPESTDLGKRIVSKSIALINQMGLEHFTFRKLANQINSTEASVYRYFENKHKLLIYLVSWYWNWQEFQLVWSINNIEQPEERLKIALKTISRPITVDPTFEHINEVDLHQIVIAESSKAYLTKEVDQDNKEGYFAGYKSLCRRISEIIENINPDYPYPAALVSTVIESAHDQRYFAEHLPTLTDIQMSKDYEITDFVTDLVFKAIRK